MSSPQLLYNAYIMHINSGITFVVMNNAVYPTRLSSVPKATCLIAHPLPRASMPEVTEMVVCTTFMSHLPDVSLSNSRHPRDCHVRYNLSHSTSP